MKIYISLLLILFVFVVNCQLNLDPDKKREYITIETFANPPPGSVNSNQVQEFDCAREWIKAEICKNDGKVVCGDDGKNYEDKCYACFSGNVRYFTMNECGKQRSGLSNFQECANAGYEIKQTNPKQCVAADGKIFVEEIFIECTQEKKMIEVCPQQNQAVCGDDGITYTNECFACKNKQVQKFSVGQCKEQQIAQSTETYDHIKSFQDCLNANFQIIETYPRQCTTPNQKTFIQEISQECNEDQKNAQICPQIWLPVCGDNGITYGNDCQACQSKAISKWTLGECNAGNQATGKQDRILQQSSIQNFQDCQAAGWPIQEGYPRQCVTGDGRVFSEDNLKVCTEDQKQDKVCPEVYIPVCGDDGVTYGNDCQACSSKKVQK